MITHLEPDILECEVKWALGSITTNKLVEVMEFQLSYYKGDAMKVLHSMSENLENSAMATGLEKVSFHFNPKERQCQKMLKLPHISHTSKVMLKILQARLQQYMNCELPDVQAGFRKGRGTTHQIANIHWIIKKAR